MQMFVLLVLLICALQHQQWSQLARSGEASPSEMVQLAAINMIIPLRNCCSKHNILRCAATAATAELRLAVQKCTQISILGQENEIALASTTLCLLSPTMCMYALIISNIYGVSRTVLLLASASYT